VVRHVALQWAARAIFVCAWRESADGNGVIKLRQYTALRQYFVL
jgi:hypothetical protein